MPGVVVSVLNMKGGVGKTTISAHVMRVLYLDREKKVLLIDLDPQFNLTQALLTRVTYEKIKGDGKTIFSAMEPPSQVGLLEVATTSQPPPNASMLAHRLKAYGKDVAYLDLIPGNFELVKYSLVSEKSKLDKVQKRFLHFVALAKKEYDLIVIDCNPSSSFITLCALHACSQVLVPVRPDRYSVLGLELVADFLERVPTIDPKPDITVILNSVRNADDQEAENELRAHETFGPMVLKNRLPHSKLLAATPGYTGFATDKPRPYRTVLRLEIDAIVSELAPLWGI